MRIVIAAPPKTGNHWIKCLLATIYDLEVLEGDDKPRVTHQTFSDWMASGGFPDGSIIHVHNRHSPGLVQVLKAASIFLVTMIRDPYDLFVSLYHWANEKQTRGLEAATPRPRHALVGKHLDDPAVLGYLSEDFGIMLEKAVGWMKSGDSIVVRYERLHTHPVEELTRITRSLQPANEERINHAILYCHADNMRQRDVRMQWHIRGGMIGESRKSLGDEHLTIMREQHSALIEALGYPVR